MLALGFLDAPGGRAADALVDRESIVLGGRGFGGVAVAEVAVADSFQGACLLQGHAEVAGDGQCLVVVVAGLLAGLGPGSRPRAKCFFMARSPSSFSVSRRIGGQP
jgi:hypothetical protein